MDQAVSALAKVDTVTAVLGLAIILKSEDFCNSKHASYVRGPQRGAFWPVEMAQHAVNAAQAAAVIDYVITHIHVGRQSQHPAKGSLCQA